MKKLIVVLTALTFSLGAAAQEKKMHDEKMHNEHKMKEEVKMNDGKMMMLKDGKWMQMESDMTMSNGTIVTPSGMVTMKDGKTMQLKNGEKMDMNGKIMEKKMEK